MSSSFFIYGFGFYYISQYWKEKTVTSKIEEDKFIWKRKEIPYSESLRQKN